jgi:copper chaperone
MSEVTISVPGIHCEACENAIMGALGRLDGVDRVEVDLDAKLVHVDYRDPVTGALLTGAIEEQGYDVGAINDGSRRP